MKVVPTSRLLLLLPLPLVQQERGEGERAKSYKDWSTCNQPAVNWSNY